jgi:hypothetical protein
VERDRWARAREAWLWSEFQKDRKIVDRNRTGPFDVNPAGGAAIRTSLKTSGFWRIDLIHW